MCVYIVYIYDSNMLVYIYIYARINVLRGSCMTFLFVH